MLKSTPLQIPGASLVELPASQDLRGEFVKTFREDWFGFRPAECFTTLSHARVLRGMHLQLPPMDHAKVVSCSAGSALDVLLDLRRGSPTYLQAVSVNLSERDRHSVLIPPGVAHGFYVLQGPAILHYWTSTQHAPALDAGVHWSSFGFAWPDPDPILSERDRKLPLVESFETPFHFAP